MTLWSCRFPTCATVETLSDLAVGTDHAHEGRLYPLRITPPTPKPAVPVDYAAFSAPLPPQKEAPRLRRKKRRTR